MKAMLVQDMCAYYGFRATPFTRELRYDHQLWLEPFQLAYEGLRRTVEERQSAALIAAAGTGKTNVLRRLFAELPAARFSARYLKLGDLSRRDMCRQIADALRVSATGHLPSLVKRIQERCEQLLGDDGARPVIIVDDAHDLRPEALGLLRVLTNFDMDSRLVVALVLCGQPPLATMLARNDLEDIARRLVHYASLRLLARDETGQYLAHRCTIGGVATTPFDGGAQQAIYEMTRGNLRAIDVLALEALVTAARHESTYVEASHVADARRRVVPVS